MSLMRLTQREALSLGISQGKPKSGAKPRRRKRPKSPDAIIAALQARGLQVEDSNRRPLAK